MSLPANGDRASTGDARLVAGKYSVSGPVFQGGMGRVQRATHVTLGTPVAIKRVILDGSDDEVARARFENEAHAVAALRHPHVIRVLDHGADAEGPYLVLEWLEGETLRDRIARTGALDPRETLRIVEGVARALDHAHGAGIVHRDLKPENIHLGDEGGAEIVKVLDFGVAKRVGHKGSLTESGAMIGTPAYMSPEQITNAKDVDGASDRWSLGAVAFECLTGERPFDGEGVGELVLQICSLPLPVPSRTAGVPRAVDGWFAIACHRDPEQRFPTACALAAALGEALSGTTTEPTGPALAPRGSPGVASSPSGPRNRPVRATIVAVAVAVVALAAFAAVSSSRSKGEERSAESSPPVASASASAAPRRLLVLPVEVLDPKTDLNVFAIGGCEDLIGELSRRPELRVIARTTAMRHQGSNRPPGEIGRELGAGVVLAGTLRPEGVELRLAVELLETEGQTVLWSRSYRRAPSEIRSAFAEVARDVAPALGLSPSPPEPRARATPSHAAYTAHVRGRYFLAQRSEAGLLRAVSYFEQAIKEDPSFAPPYLGLADSYLILPYMSGFPRADATSRARAALEKGLALDPSSSWAHTTRGGLLVEVDWKFQEAEKVYRHAIDLDPSNVTAHQWYGELLMMFRRFDEAIAEMRLALDLDPLSVPTHKNFAQVLLYARRFAEAEEEAKRTIEMDPEQPYARYYLGQACIETGRIEEGIAAIREDRAFNYALVRPALLVQELHAAARAGRQDRVTALLAEIEATPLGQVQPFLMGFAYASAGRADAMFAMLDRALTERALFTPYIALQTAFDPYRGDPRFVSLMRRLGL